MRNVTGVGDCSVASLKLAALTTKATKQPYCRLLWIVFPFKERVQSIATVTHLINFPRASILYHKQQKLGGALEQG